MNLTDRLVWGLSFAILTGLLLGCSSLETGDQVWFKPGGTYEERERLLGAAQVQAAQAHAVPKPGSPDHADARRQTERQAVLATMTAAGWRLVPRAQAGALEHERKTASPQRSNTAPVTLDR